jgi:hypothetical protein
MVIQKPSRKKSSKIWTMPKSELELIVKSKENLAQVLKTLGYGPTGGSHKVLKNRLLKEDIDFSHMKMGVM